MRRARRGGPTRRRPLPAIAAALLACAVPALPLAAPAAVSGATTPKAPHTPKPPKAARPPAASTGDAKDIAESSAELSGAVNPHGSETSYFFQYGPTTAYGAQTPTVSAGAGTLGVKVDAALSGLQLGTVYHYRLVAQSAAGTTSGIDRTFTTKQIPLRFELATKSATVAYGRPSTLTGTLTGTGGAGQGIALQANPFPFAVSFAAFGATGVTNADGGFSLPVPALTQTTKLRVCTLGSPPIYSQAVEVKVAVLASLSVHGTREAGLMRMSGVVTPAVPGATVAFQLMKTGRHPQNVGQTTAGRARGGSSRFAALVTVRRTGSYRAVVKVSNGRLVSGTSATVHIRAPRRVRKVRPAGPRHR